MAGSGRAATVEAGVSRALAAGRAARVSQLRYSLEFTVAAHASTVAGHETIAFDDTGSGDLALDYRDGSLTRAVLNGKAIATTLENGHLMLPGDVLRRRGNDMRGNELTLEFASNAATAGKAFTRYEDKDDGSEYLYTLFVPMDASMAFPCFDQPDLKGRFTLTVHAPAEWTVVGNTAAGEPTMYVRKSQLARAKVEAPQVQQMAVRGVKYFADTFAQPYPFPKYELVLIPGFPFGGMEHAGETFLNEDGVLFRTAPTQTDYFRRNILVLPPVVRRPGDDALVRRPVAEGGLCAVHGVQGADGAGAGAESVEAFLRRDQATGVRHRRDAGHDADLSGHSELEGCEVGLWGDCVPEGSVGAEGAELLCG
jgi:aminopeptidase N